MACHHRLSEILPFIDTDIFLPKRDDIHNFLSLVILAKNIYGEEAFGLNVFSIYGAGI